MKLFSFENDVIEHSDIYTTYQNELLILHDVRFYIGPLTMQYLPFGGIQSTFNHHLIIHVKNGYIHPNKITYQNQTYSEFEFVDKYVDLVNQILPN